MLSVGEIRPQPQTSKKEYIQAARDKYATLKNVPASKAVEICFGWVLHFLSQAKTNFSALDPTGQTSAEEMRLKVALNLLILLDNNKKRYTNIVNLAKRNGFDLPGYPAPNAWEKACAVTAPLEAKILAARGETGPGINSPWAVASKPDVH